MTQDLCIKKSLQGINELCGGAFCKYIAQNNHTILLVTLTIPPNVLEPCYRAAVCVLYTFHLLGKHWETVATKHILFKLNPMHSYVSLPYFVHTSLCHSLYYLYSSCQVQKHYPMPGGRDGETLLSQTTEF